MGIYGFIIPKNPEHCWGYTQLSLTSIINIRKGRTMSFFNTLSTTAAKNDSKHVAHIYIIYNIYIYNINNIYIHIHILYLLFISYIHTFFPISQTSKSFPHLKNGCVNTQVVLKVSPLWFGPKIPQGLHLWDVAGLAQKMDGPSFCGLSDGKPL